MKARPIPAEYLEPEFLDAKVAPRLAVEGECLVWTGPVDHGGYGRVTVSRPGQERRSLIVHRLVYTAMHGPVPEGLVLDHDVPGWGCGNKRCVLHVLPTTHRQNLLNRRYRKASG
jgi:hypothetical protein